jgi:hypothetical protein
MIGCLAGGLPATSPSRGLTNSSSLESFFRLFRFFRDAGSGIELVMWASSSRTKETKEI